MGITIPVYGSTVEWSDDNTTWADIPQAKAVVIPELNQDFRDVTSLDSTGGYREWAPGLKDGGEITLECYYSKELYAEAETKNAAGAAVYFRVTLPVDDDQATGDAFVYQGYVTPSIPQGDIDGDMMINLKVRVTGAVTWTQGTAS